MLIAIGSLSLGGCQNNEAPAVIEQDDKEAVVKVKEQAPLDKGKIIQLPSDNAEYAILKAGGVDIAMVYDLQLGSQRFTQVDAWIDRYDKGKFTSMIGVVPFEFINAADPSHQANHEYKLYYTFSKLDSVEQEKITIALREDQGLAMTEMTQPLKDLTSGIVHSLPVEEIIPGKTHDLALLAWNKNSGGTTSDVEETIKNNELVYVLRCKFTAAEGSQS
ncbi:hypothetical protein DNH61_03015 [Paenibacillus sambharensis]|uniref:Uncharacterized protein n=1 Tax=Paenibacillus sambharensis TaxID=1803190 RepID=A0A2W1M0U5_9BACL|nr:hypothetical protein DNH61_03015 [Paenibacillus sambharensis]